MAKRLKVKDIDENAISVLECINEFMEYKESENISAPTKRNYLYALDRFIDYFEIDDNFQMADITEGMIIKWKNHLLNQNVSFETVNSYIRILNIFLKWSAEREYCGAIKVKLVRGQQTRLKYYTEEEMNVLLQKPIDNNNFGVWRTWAIIAFIYATGARAQSVCDVKIEDLDFKVKEVVFTHQKNKSILVLPISPQLEKILKEYIKRCGLEEEEYLFPSISGEKLKPHNMNLSVNRFCQQRGIEGRGVHAIRHSFASQYIRNGGNPIKLQKILNHQNFAVTERYLHLFGSDLKIDYSDFSPLDNAIKHKGKTKRVGR